MDNENETVESSLPSSLPFELPITMQQLHVFFKNAVNKIGGTQFPRTIHREVKRYSLLGKHIGGFVREENEDVPQEFIAMKRPVRRSQLVLWMIPRRM